jgi:hypothetical protein
MFKVDGKYDVGRWRCNVRVAKGRQQNVNNFLWKEDLKMMLYFEFEGGYELKRHDGNYKVESRSMHT